MSRFHPSSWEACRLCDDTWVFTYLWLGSVCCQLALSADPGPVAVTCPHPPVDNNPHSSWGAVLHFSCNLLLVSSPCLTSCRHLSCHLPFTFTNPFFLCLSEAGCPTSHLSPCLDNPTPPQSTPAVAKAWFLIKPSNCEVKSQFHAPYSW